MGILIRSLSQALQDETLGFLSRPTVPGTLEILYQATVISFTLRQALERMCLFYRVIDVGMHFHLSEESETAKLTLVYDNPHQLDSLGFITLDFLATQRWIDWMVGRRLPLDRVDFQDSLSDYVDYYKMVFGCDCIGESEDYRLTFRP